MIRFKHKGNFSKTSGFLERATKCPSLEILERYGKEGVKALATWTPKDTGLTAASWGYEIIVNPGRSIIRWTNSNIQNGINVAVLIQYDHATGTGGFVKGQDYINPAMKPIFDAMLKDVWKEATG